MQMSSISALVVGISGYTYESLKQNKYLYSAFIFVAFFVLSKLLVFVFERIILRLTKKTKTNLDDLIIQNTGKPISLILLFLGVKLAIIPLDIHDNVVGILYKVIDSIIILTVTYGILQIVYVLIGEWRINWVHKTKSKIDDHLVGLLNSSAKYVVALIGIMFILQSWEVKIGPLLASLGIAGIAVAFAMQTTLGNIFGGVSLVVDQTIKVGDVIKLDSGELGTIQSIGIRSTKLITPENILLSIPNGKLADSKIQNISAPDMTLRIALDIGVEYGSDPDKVKYHIWQEISTIKDVLKEPKPRVFFTEMGDFALKFKVLFWIDNIDKKLEKTDEALARIYRILNKNKIGIPFPTRTVYMKK